MDDKSLDEMTEAEQAAYFQAHKDDEDQWEDLSAPIESKRRRKSRDLSAVITVRFTPEEAELVRHESKRLGLPYSEIVRRAVQHLVRPVVLGEETQSA